MQGFVQGQGLANKNIQQRNLKLCRNQTHSGQNNIRDAENQSNSKQIRDVIE